MALKSSDLASVLIFSSVPNQIGHDIPGIDHSLFTLQGYLSFHPQSHAFYQASPKKMEVPVMRDLQNITISQYLDLIHKYTNCSCAWESLFIELPPTVAASAFLVVSSCTGFPANSTPSRFQRHCPAAGLTRRFPERKSASCAPRSAQLGNWKMRIQEVPERPRCAGDTGVE